jgi:hypothetical protein
MHSTIARLKKNLPAFLTVEQYCELRNCSRATTYKDMHRVDGLAVKIGPSTRLRRDVALDQMARAASPQPWVPMKDRSGDPAIDRARSRGTTAAQRVRTQEAHT